MKIEQNDNSSENSKLFSVVGLAALATIGTVAMFGCDLQSLIEGFSEPFRNALHELYKDQYIAMLIDKLPDSEVPEFRHEMQKGWRLGTGHGGRTKRPGHIIKKLLKVNEGYESPYEGD